MFDAPIMKHLTLAELEAALPAVLGSPKDAGPLELIVGRPAVGRRAVLETGELDLVTGLVGDTWNIRTSRRTPDGSPHPDMQITVMNSRVIALIAGEKARWGLAGDQLYVDFDLRAVLRQPGQVDVPAGPGCAAVPHSQTTMGPFTASCAKWMWAISTSAWSPT